MLARLKETVAIAKNLNHAADLRAKLQQARLDFVRERRELDSYVAAQHAAMYEARRKLHDDQQAQVEDYHARLAVLDHRDAALQALAKSLKRHKGWILQLQSQIAALADHCKGIPE